MSKVKRHKAEWLAKRKDLDTGIIELFRMLWEAQVSGTANAKEDAILLRQLMEHPTAYNHLCDCSEKDEFMEDLMTELGL